MTIIVPAYNAPPSLAAKHEAAIGDIMRQRTLDEGWIPQLPDNSQSEGTIARRVVDPKLEAAIVSTIRDRGKPIAIAEIADRLGEDRSAVSNAMHRMVARGELAKWKVGRSVKWGPPHFAVGAGIGSPTSSASVCFPRLPARKQ